MNRNATVKIIIEAKDENGTLAKVQRVIQIPDSDANRETIKAESEEIIASEMKAMTKPIFDAFFAEKKVN